MSTDGTKPPSIAPRGTGTTGTAGPRPRPVPPPVPNGLPPSARGGEPVEDKTEGRSLADRVRGAASSVAETARNAMPARGDDHDAEPARPERDRGEPGEPAGPRKVRLALSRVDPWSVMKLAFLLSVAAGIMIVVAAAVVWQTLNSLEVFTSVNDTIAEITGDPGFFDLLEFVAFDRVMALATMVAVVDVVLMTALATLGAFLYNIVAVLVGGIHVTLTDD